MDSTQPSIVWEKQLVGMIRYFQIVKHAIRGVVQIKVTYFYLIKVTFLSGYFPYAIMEWGIDTWITRRIDDDSLSVSICLITPYNYITLKHARLKLQYTEHTCTSNVVRVSRVSQVTVTII